MSSKSYVMSLAVAILWGEKRPMTHRILAGPSVGPHTFVSLKIYETDQSLILIRFDLQYFSPVHFLFHLAFFITFTSAKISYKW